MFQYHTVFEPYTPNSWVSPGTWLVVAGACIVVILIRILLFGRPRWWVLLTYVALASAVGAGIQTLGRSADRLASAQAAQFRRAANDPATPRVEGRVVAFRPAPAEGHQNETFVVTGVPFSYSDYVITGGFNQTRSHGGPIREGLRVRITYVRSRAGNIVVRLEVADSS